MSYYADLSNYEYTNFEYTIEGYKVLNVGWIDGLHKFEQGDVSDECLESLWEYIKIPFNRMRGLHGDDILDGQNKMFVANFEGYAITLGDAEIRVIDEEQKVVYASPNMILHYIINHRYYPPQCFINAVMYGPKPGSDVYRKILIEKNHDHVNSMLECIYCKDHDTRIGYSHNTNQIKTKNIIITEGNNNTKMIQDNRIYRAICRKCGGIFEVSFNKSSLFRI